MFLLVDRNPSKLEATSNEIRARFGDQQVDIKNVVADFATLSGPEISKAIEGSIKELDVGVLINNIAGVSYPNARFFHEVDWKMTESYQGEFRGSNLGHQGSASCYVKEEKRCNSQYGLWLRRRPSFIPIVRHLCLNQSVPWNVFKMHQFGV